MLFNMQACLLKVLKLGTVVMSMQHIINRGLSILGLQKIGSDTWCFIQREHQVW